MIQELQKKCLFPYIIYLPISDSRLDCAVTGLFQLTSGHGSESGHIISLSRDNQQRLVINPLARIPGFM